MDTETEITTANLTNQIGRLSISGALRLLTELFPGQVSFSTSFSLEDQVILQHIAADDLPINVFTLDTGRLFPETYSVWTASREKYSIPIKAYTPDLHLLEPYVQEKGPNAFYESVENRKQCCFIRKVEPLKRALAGQKIWITGIRAEHSGNRSQLHLLEWDAGNAGWREADRDGGGEGAAPLPRPVVPLAALRAGAENDGGASPRAA